jgi:hypothetical protein
MIFLTLSAIHLNEDVFGIAVKAAGLHPFQTYRLLEAARDARQQPGVDICCETVTTFSKTDRCCASELTGNEHADPIERGLAVSWLEFVRRPSDLEFSHAYFRSCNPLSPSA